ncbi:MAG: HU family DNA-binding protein [Paludibacteraceae bacterium]|nr:HU family DNA-binding protein [Paludibacteraceae bacterium]
MNDKLTWTELRHAVAKRTGMSEKEAGQFLQAFVEQIIAGLKTDQSVRINGLGTFRLQAVAPRRSVNVTTGEAMMIPGYNKLNFLPESSTKELIQSATRTQEEATPLQKLSDQADEIEGILGEINAIPETPVKPEEPASPAEPETKIESIGNIEPIGSIDKAPETQKEPEAPKPEEPKKKKYHPLRDGLITIACILLLLLVAFYFLKHSLMDFANGLVEKIHTEAPAPQVTQPTQPVSEETIAIPTEEPQAQKAESIEQKPAPKPATITRTYTEFIGTEKLHADSRLAWVAYKYYGEKDCWVFLWEANRDHLTNPHKIRKGTPIRIPKLPAEWKDMSNPQTRQMVDEMIELYK